MKQRQALACFWLLVLVLAIVTALAGCIRHDWDGMDLVRPPFHCITNPFPVPMIVYAEGRFTPLNLAGVPPGATVYRRIEIRRGTATPGVPYCFRWPWASRDGRVIGYAGADSLVGPWIDPYPAKDKP